MKRSPETIYFPGTDLTIERNTAVTPSAGKYFIVKNGEVVGKGFAKLGLARNAIEPMLEELGWAPSLTASSLRSPEEALREEINWREDWRSEMFLSQSSQHGKGGKLSNR
jgi:hypothetical protein